MNEQAIGLLIVWAIGVGALVVLLIIFRGFLQWLIGTSDIIRLLEEQNAILKQSPPPTATPTGQATMQPPRRKFGRFESKRLD